MCPPTSARVSFCPGRPGDVLLWTRLRTGVLDRLSPWWICPFRVSLAERGCVTREVTVFLAAHDKVRGARHRGHEGRVRLVAGLSAASALWSALCLARIL